LFISVISAVTIFLSPSAPIDVALKKPVDEINTYGIYRNGSTNHYFYSSVNSFVYQGVSHKTTVKRLTNNHCMLSKSITVFSKMSWWVLQRKFLLLV